MKVAVSLPIVEAMKDELRRCIPEVKSSHRAEALARGLGWNTNASMRASLVSSPSERDVVPAAFYAYLAEHGAHVAERLLPETICRTHIRAVMTEHDQLTHHGFGVYNGDRISVSEWRSRYAKSRDEMLGASAIGEFERACEYLAKLETTRAPTTVFHTYNLKHSAERWHRHCGIEGRWDRDYVSNGMLLTAAFHLGLRVRRASATSSVGYLNVSTTSVRALEDQRKPILPQPEEGEPFRVLGRLMTTQCAGRSGYITAGSTKLISLGDAEHTPKNLLRLAPIEYWATKFPPRNRRATFDTEGAFCELLRRASKVGIFDPSKFRQMS